MRRAIPTVCVIVGTIEDCSITTSHGCRNETFAGADDTVKLDRSVTRSVTLLTMSGFLVVDTVFRLFGTLNLGIKADSRFVKLCEVASDTLENQIFTDDATAHNIRNVCRISIKYFEFLIMCVSGRDFHQSCKIQVVCES